jgi:Ca2+-binding EF-hand superfamily protein
MKVLQKVYISLFAVVFLTSPLHTFADGGWGKKGYKRFSIQDLDSNQDNKLSFEEFSAKKKKQKGDKYKLCDEVSLADKFKNMDKNADGFVDSEELQQYRKDYKGGKWGKYGKGKKRAAAKFRFFDTNKDGKISKDEFIEARGNRVSKRVKEGGKMKNLKNMPSFEDIDQNNDGQIDKNEFKTFKKKRREKSE